MKKILSLIMIVCLILVATACQSGPSTGPTADPNKVHKLKVSFAAPEFSTTEITAALDRIQEASKGRIEFVYYYAWTITSVPTVVDDLNNGVCDIAALPINEHLNLFPYSNLITYTPFLGLPGMLETADLFTEMHNEQEAISKEYTNAGLHYWTNYPMPGYNIYTTDKNNAIKKPEDLKGLKLISSSALMQAYITAHQGAAVTAPVTEYATSLNTNVVDGIINHINVLAAFGCMDFIQAATVFGDSGTATAPMVMAISEKVWSQLSPDLQKLFNDEAKNLSHGQGGWDRDANERNINLIEEKGGTVTRLTEAEIKVWADAFAAQREAYIDQLIADGHTEARKVYDALQAKLAG